jgi:anti-sigma regulatory factor (Ser/Thr protein kinase)
MNQQVVGRHGGVTTDSASSISVDLAISYESGWLARRTVEPLRSCMSSQAFEDLRLVVTELVTNAVRHGGKRGSVRLAVRCLPRTVEVRVSSPEGVTEPALVPHARDGEGRLGLRIIDHLAEGWGVERAPGRTTVWAVLPRES